MPAGQEEACEAVNVGTIPNRGTRSGTGLDFGGGGLGEVGEKTQVLRTGSQSPQSRALRLGRDRTLS